VLGVREVFGFASPQCHPGGGRGPLAGPLAAALDEAGGASAECNRSCRGNQWVPAFAGMTPLGVADAECGVFFRGLARRAAEDAEKREISHGDTEARRRKSWMARMKRAMTILGGGVIARKLTTAMP